MRVLPSIEAGELLPPSARKVLIACGNTLRGDDAIGPLIAEAVERGAAFADVDVIVVPQLTAELAADLRGARTVVFVDAAVGTPPGEVAMLVVEPSLEPPQAFSHQLSPAALLALTAEIYQLLPGHAFTVTVGAASFALGDSVSEPIRAALPEALTLLRDIFGQAQ